MAPIKPADYRAKEARNGVAWARSCVVSSTVRILTGWAISSAALVRSVGIRTNIRALTKGKEGEDRGGTYSAKSPRPLARRAIRQASVLGFLPWSGLESPTKAPEMR